MDESNNISLFFVGEKFDSFEKLTCKLDNYCKTSFVHYWTRDSRKIDGARIVRRINKDLKYYSLKYTCVLGGQAFHSRGTGQRYSFSIRATNCPAHISFRASKDGQHLEVISVNNDHNHEQSEEFFRALPKERRIPDSIKSEILDLIKLQVDKSRVKEYVRLQTQKILSTKDLTNIISCGRLENRPNLTPERSKELLKKVYDLEVKANYPEIKDVTKAKKRRTSYPIPKETYGIVDQDSSVIIDCIVSEPIVTEIIDCPFSEIKAKDDPTLPHVSGLIKVVHTEEVVLGTEGSSESLVVEDSEQYCVTCGQNLPKDNALIQGSLEKGTSNEIGNIIIAVKQEDFESFALQQITS